MLVVSCSGGGGGTTPSQASTAASAPSADATAIASAASPQSATFANPVINADFPDPFLANFDGTYYAYGTGTQGKNIQLTSSPDLVHWQPPQEALLRLPRWIAKDTWAPEVAHTSAGYVMYYSGRSGAVQRPNGEGALCISVAVADSPAGPFIDQSESPLVCQPELGGSIDATYFADDGGTQYLVWKNDGNCCAIATKIWMQPLAADGLSLAGTGPSETGLVSDAPWERGIVEAPTLIHHDDTYYMFYSGNEYESHRYAVGYAASESVTGPYVDAAENPILVNAAPAVGPGHQSIVADDDGDLWMAYHAWDVSALGYQAGGRRALWIDPLVFNGAAPDVHGPNASPQPLP